MTYQKCDKKLNTIFKIYSEKIDLFKLIEILKINLCRNISYIKKYENMIKFNKKYHIKCKILSLSTEIMSIEETLKLQYCLRLQKYKGKNIESYHMISLDLLKQYSSYLSELKNELVNYRLDLIDFDENDELFKKEKINEVIKYLTEKNNKYNLDIINIYQTVHLIDNKIERYKIYISSNILKLRNIDKNKITHKIKFGLNDSFYKDFKEYYDELLCSNS